MNATLRYLAALTLYHVGDTIDSAIYALNSDFPHLAASLDGLWERRSTRWLHSILFPYWAYQLAMKWSVDLDRDKRVWKDPFADDAKLVMWMDGPEPELDTEP